MPQSTPPAAAELPPTPSPARPRGPGQDFRTSIVYVLGSMLLALLSQVLYEDFLLPRGVMESPWVRLMVVAWGVLLLAGVAANFRWLYRLASSVRTSVVILSTFALCCVAGSFVLQERDLDTRGLTGEKAYEAFRLAEAGFLHYMIHGQKYQHPMSDNGTAFFETLGERFGEKYARERTELFHKMMGGRTKDAEIAEFAEEHDAWFRVLWNVCRATRIADIHRSWMFVTLMLLLSISLVAGTAKRFVWRADQIGFYATHMGFVVLMIGFALSLAAEQRGILPLTVGQTLGKIWEFHADKPLDLGFTVTLEDFYTEHHPEIFAEFGDVDFQARGFPGPIQRSLKPYKGSEYPLWDGRYQVEVLDYAEYGSANPEVVEAPEGPANPALRIDIDSPDGAGAQGWLFALSGSQSLYEDPSGRFLLSFHLDEAEALAPPSRGDWGDLRLEAEGHEPLVVTVRPDARFDYAGKHFRVARIAPDFAQREAPTETQQVRNPAVLLEVAADGEEPKPRWSFAWIDFDSMHTPPHAEVRLAYRFRSGNLDPRKVLHLLGQGDTLELIGFDAEGKAWRRPVPLDQVVPTDIEAFTLRVEARYQRAARVFRVDPLYERDLLEHDREHPSRGWSGTAGYRDEGTAPGAGAGAPPPAGHDEHDGHDHGAATEPAGSGSARAPHAAGPSPASVLGPLPPDVQRSFHPPGPPAVKLRITHPGGSLERWFLAGHPEAGSWQDGTLSLRFAPNTNKVKEWRSVLIASDGKSVRRQVVRVNHTMEFAGWTMYQTDADAERPDYSGIQVLRDPGWYLIEPGLMLVCFGVIFMFWVKPWLRMDQSGGARARPAQGGA